MISPICKSSNSLAEWSQNWLDVMAFDPAGIERGIPYIYQMLGLPAPTIFYLDGWQECLHQILTNHADQRDFSVNRDSGQNPSFKIKYKNNQYVEPSFHRFLWLLREDISMDWAASEPVYPLEQNKELSRLMHVLLNEMAHYKTRWQLLHKQIYESVAQTASLRSSQNALCLDMHYLTRQWLQLDATLLANEFYQQKVNTIYNWSLVLDFIKGKSFATYYTHDVVYCVRPPILIDTVIKFSNGEEYAAPLTTKN